MSGGERTRLALCQLLLSPSNFLILDEPTAMLDPLARLDMFEFLNQLTQTGMGVLLVSHIVGEVRQANNIYCLDSGKVDCFNGFIDFSQSEVFRTMGWDIGIRDGLERFVNDF